MDSTKPCYVCGVVKPLWFFSLHSGMADGHLNKCKLCAIAYTRAWEPGYSARRRAQRTQDAGMISCIRCGSEYPRTMEFWGGRRFEYTGPPTFCRNCMAYYSSFSRGDLLALDKPNHRQSREATFRLKLRVLQAYSGLDAPQCACCGQDEFLFLSIDHTAGGGGKHRKELGRLAGRPFYHWLSINSFPPGFQVLCHNCNMAKGYYGTCPHSRETTPVCANCQ